MWRPALHSLRYTLALTVSLSLLLPALVFSGIAAYRTYHEERPLQLQRALTHYADLIGGSMSNNLWNLDENAANALMSNLLKDPAIRRVRIEQNDGMVWLERSSPETVGEVQHLVRPLKQDGQLIGQVLLEMSDAPLRAELTQKLRQQLVIVVVQLLVSLSLILLFLTRRVSRPLESLGQQAQQLASGQLETPIVSDRADEIGLLAQQFEYARQNLRQSFAALSDLNEQLEQRVLRRTHELELSNQALQDNIEELNRTRDEVVRSEKFAALGSLVAGVAHELNTPIGNALTVSSSLHNQTQDFASRMHLGLRKSEFEQLISDQITGTELIQRNIHRAAELISSFKQVAVDQSSDRRREFTLLELCQEIMQTVQHRLRQHHVSVQLDIPDTISLDSFPGPLGQILLNLINNALLHAFGAEGGAIRLYAQQQSKQQILLIFSDNGQGIPAEDLPRIFDPFFTTKLGQGGSGLGLPIVFRLVHSVLGGQIKVSSDLGVGTRFEIKLPNVAPNAETGETA